MMVSVVIPNYNGKHFLEECLNSLKVQTYKKFEIIVVDNASSDGSVEFIKTFDPSVRLIELNTNTGFSPAVNVGIKEAKGDYIFLLNNDTVSEPNVIEKLVGFIESDDKIFSVNSKMIQFNNRTLIDDAGDEYNLFGWAYKRGYNQRKNRHNKYTRVFSCCGGASLYRKSVFDEIGYFDEAFFAYLEDVDVGYRANCYGYKNYYCPEAVVYHIISGTTGNKKTEFKTKLSARNNTYLIYKNMPTLQLIINMPFIIIGCVIKGLFFYKYGFHKIYFKESFKAIFEFKNLNKTKFIVKNSINYLWIQYKLTFNCLFFIIERIKTKI